MIFTKSEGDLVVAGLILTTLTVAALGFYNMGTLMCGLTVFYNMYNENRT